MSLLDVEAVVAVRVPVEELSESDSDSLVKLSRDRGGNTAGGKGGVIRQSGIVGVWMKASVRSMAGKRSHRSINLASVLLVVLSLSVLGLERVILVLGVVTAEGGAWCRLWNQGA